VKTKREVIWDNIGLEEGGMTRGIKHKFSPIFVGGGGLSEMFSRKGGEDPGSGPWDLYQCPPEKAILIIS